MESIPDLEIAIIKPFRKIVVFVPYDQFFLKTVFGRLS